jgi:plastocyanin
MRTLPRLAVLCLVTTVGLGVAPAAAGGGCHEAAENGQSEGTGTTVELSANCMRPTVLHTEAGSTVTFVNRDAVQHNLFGTTWGFGVLQPEASVTQRFDDEGVYPFACTLHPGMVGAVVVGELAAPAAAAPVADETSLAVPLGAGGVVAAGGLALAGLLRRRRSAQPMN